MELSIKSFGAAHNTSLPLSNDNSNKGVDTVTR